MIIASAIKFSLASENHEYPHILSGKRHADIYEKMAHYFPKDYNHILEGFLTDNYEFLDRYEAKEYAIKRGQTKGTEFAELYSEDLWPEED